jgi:hypothetical protein
MHAVFQLKFPLAASTSVAVTTPHVSYVYFNFYKIAKLIITINRTTTETVTTSVPPSVIPRGAPTPIPIPPGLGIFIAAQISSACSCLSIPESVVKTTSTAPTMVRVPDHLIPEWFVRVVDD